MIKLYNTLSKGLESFDPIGDTVRMYSCGPTVYNYAHIGNLRSFIVADLLYRSLKYEFSGKKKVRWVMNITDIDDKTIKGAIAESGKNATVKDLYNFTEKYLQEFKKDLKEVNVSIAEIELIRVTDKMDEIAAFIKDLVDKGYAYKTDDGSIYFSIEKYQADFGDYGQLVGTKFIEGKKVGARVKVDEYDKDSLSDFALWKAHDENDAQIFWEYPEQGLVKGRPGWHIECSVINNVAFGEPTHIHTGGVDLIFPHHTNEIAQSQANLGKGNFVKHWFHSEHLFVDSKKMSKSLNNFYTLSDIKAKGFSGLDFRYMMMTASYRAEQNFTDEALQNARNALRKLYTAAEADDAEAGGFKDSLENNLNLPQALESVWKAKGQTLLDFDTVLGLGLDNPPNVELPNEIQELMNDREAAKQSKDFAKSDELRKQIEDAGYELMDTPEGQKVRKK